MSQNDTTAKPHPGVVGIFTDKLGRVVATVSDFNRDAPGGCSLREGQTWRCQRLLALEVVRAYCSQMILEGIEAYDCERILSRLCEKGATTTYIPIGHPDER